MDSMPLLYHLRHHHSQNLKKPASFYFRLSKLFQVSWLHRPCNQSNQIKAKQRPWPSSPIQDYSQPRHDHISHQQQQKNFRPNFFTLKADYYLWFSNFYEENNLTALRAEKKVFWSRGKSFPSFLWSKRFV